MPDTSPARARLKRFVSLAPSRVDHIPAFRIAVGLAVPLAVLLLTDRVEWTLYAAFGAFTGIYSRYESTGLRFRRQTLVGALLTVCVGIGAALAQYGRQLPGAGDLWLNMVVGALVAGGAATLITQRGIKPGGAVFPLFAVSAVAAAPAAAPVWLAVLIAATSALWCVLLGLAGHYSGERRPPEGVDPGRQTYAPAQLAQEFGVYTAVALLAGVIGLLSGLPYPYWAQIAAVVPLSAPGRGAQVERGIHRVIGTVLGVAVTAFLLSFPSQPWQLAVWAVVMQFLAELYVLRNYSLALCFITPLALLMVQLGNPSPVGPMLQARVAETAIGVAVGIAVVLVLFLVARRRDTAAQVA